MADAVQLGSLVFATGAILAGAGLHALLTQPRAKRKRKRGTGGHVFPPPPGPDDTPLPGIEDDFPIDDWEYEAASLPPVNDGMDDAQIEDDQESIGRGHPEDHLIIVPRVSNPTEKPYQVVDPLKDPRFAPKNRGAPFSPIGTDTTWPIITRSSARLVTSYLGNDGWHGFSGRAFGSQRESGEGGVRHHAGIDLWARERDLVVSPEDGRILAILPFHHGTWAVYIITNDRRVLNLGEVERYSWREFGVSPGDQVRMGDRVARVGKQDRGSTMIHFEAYDARDVSDEEMIELIRRGDMQWADHDHPPSRLYDPTSYLLKAASRTYRKEHGISLASG